MHVRVCPGSPSLAQQLIHSSHFLYALLTRMCPAWSHEMQMSFVEVLELSDWRAVEALSLLGLISTSMKAVIPT